MSGSRTAGLRWDLWLTAIALLVSGGLIFLAATAAEAIKARRDLALEGRALGIAHVVELDLRDAGVGAAAEIAAEALRSGANEVVGLRIANPDGEVVSEVGRISSELPSRRIDLFVGRRALEGAGSGRGRGAWGGGPPWGGRGPHRGQLTLELYFVPEAVEPPLVARVLLPVALVVAVVLVALALMGGRLLVRQRALAERRATRRRLEALARAGAGLAHQLRTPLATIKGSCQLLAERMAEEGGVGGGAERSQDDAAPPGVKPTTQRRLDTVITQVARMEQMLADLLDYARPPQPEPAEVLLEPLASEVAADVLPVSVEVPEGLAVRADPEHVRQILEILLDNARRASPADGPIEVSARSEGEVVRVTVRDHGPGPGDDPEHLFEPYVTKRADGTGLGLPIARTLTEANGGRLELRAASQGGCEAVLRLPRRASAA